MSTINNNHFSRKLKVDLFIDDRQVGGLPDWGEIYKIIQEGKSYRDIIRESMGEGTVETTGHKHWWNRK